MSKIHLVTYATGFSKGGWNYKLSQNFLVNTIQSNTKREVVFHTHNLSSIKQKPWFKYIQDFPNISLTKENRWWNRDGYWCTWKAFLFQEIFETMGEDDLIYYVDSSQHFRKGFTENLDKLVNYILKTESIFGSAGNDQPHWKDNCLDNRKVWESIWPESIRLMPRLLTTQHLLASWFILKKDIKTKNIIDEWIYLIKNIKLNNRPIFSFHHTGEQGILNVLLYKYQPKIFFSNTSHANTKNPNLLPYYFNNLVTHPQQFIITPDDINIP